eukprot:3990162-Prorocentrum_lima.AAC.1
MALANIYFEITIRHPLAARYVSAAAKESGAAARKGESDKHGTYPDTANAKLWPLCHETYGRMGPAAESMLD